MRFAGHMQIAYKASAMHARRAMQGISRPAAPGGSHSPVRNTTLGSEDHSKHVVEVVRDASGQLPPTGFSPNGTP